MCILKQFKECVLVCVYVFLSLFALIYCQYFLYVQLYLMRSWCYILLAKPNANELCASSYQLNHEAIRKPIWF